MVTLHIVDNAGSVAGIKGDDSFSRGEFYPVKSLCCRKWLNWAQGLKGEDGIMTNQSRLRAKILVSSCLLGEKVRYDGGDNELSHPKLKQWKLEGRLVSFCPECAGGLSTPRTPAERVGKRVLTKNGEDVTTEFLSGAEQAVELAGRLEIKVAILKARSPSCGSGVIYDGKFAKRLIEGNGMTTDALIAAGIKVFSEDEIEDVVKHLNEYLNED